MNLNNVDMYVPDMGDTMLTKNKSVKGFFWKENSGMFELTITKDKNKRTLLGLSRLISVHSNLTRMVLTEKTIKWIA